MTKTARIESATRIYFASDIHLGSGDAETARANERRFVAWLDRAAADAEAIFLLGDIFDFWFEYRRVVPKGFVRTLSKLAELTDRGIRIGFFPGNHDLWVRDYFRRECGMEVYPMPRILELKGQRIYMAHGDNMGVGREPPPAEPDFRSRTLRWLFSWGVHPDWAMRFGHWWSGKSRKSHAGPEGFDESLTEPLIGYARRYAETHAVDHFVFGHMHFPRDYHDGTLHTIHLGGWEKCPSYAVLDDTGALTLEMLEQ